MDRVTGLAICWRIERRDGVAIGLTDHDRDLEVDGFTYRAAPGMTPSAIVRGDGLEAATMDAKGALTSAAITERDLIAGRWDGARVGIVAVDWAAGGAPEGLPYVEPASPAKKPRDAFIFFINGAKVRAPHGAMALIERVR